MQLTDIRINSRSVKTVLSVVVPALLAACSTSYKVAYVPRDSLAKAGNEAGSYFMLPRTEVSLQFLAAETRTVYGLYYAGNEPVDEADPTGQTFKNRYDDSATACAKQPPDWPAVSPPGESRKRAPVYETSDFSIATRTSGDLDMVFRTAVDAGPFTTYKHVMEWNDDGTLKSASASIEDTRVGFALKVTDSLLKVAATAFLASGERITQQEKEAYCQGKVALAKAKPGVEEALKAATARRKAIEDGALKLPEGDLLTVALADVDKQIAALKKKAAELKALEGVSEETTSYVIVGVYDPPAFNLGADGNALTDKDLGFTWSAYKPKFEVAKANEETPKWVPQNLGVIASQGGALEVPPELKAKLDDFVFRLEPKLQVPAKLDVAGKDQGATGAKPPPATDGKDNAATDPPAKLDAPAKDSGTEEPAVQPVKLLLMPPGSQHPPTIEEVAELKKISGYPYRFPVLATLSVKRLKTATDGTVTPEPVVTATIPVAQFGPILQLPSTFGGSSSELAITYNSATGGLSKATVGAKAVTDTSAAGFIDSYATYRGADIKADEAAAKKAEEDATKAAGAETKDLEDKIKYLEALKKYRDLSATVGEIE